MVKALALGADCVMLGGLLAGAEESPGETEFVDGLMYKTYRGMGSLAAMSQGSKDRYGQAEVKESGKFVPEGIEGRTIYRGPVEKIIYQLIGGLRSGMGYNGAKTIKDLQKKAEVVKITGAGLKESHPHDITITKDAPNYFRK
jgi:IMP dehydrogenase